MVRDLLAALARAPVRHVALVTGLKHDLGPFEVYGQGAMPDTPFSEGEPRLDVANFYCAQEDELFAASARQSWSTTSGLGCSTRVRKYSPIDDPVRSARHDDC